MTKKMCSCNLSTRKLNDEYAKKFCNYCGGLNYITKDEKIDILEKKINDIDDFKLLVVLFFFLSFFVAFTHEIIIQILVDFFKILFMMY